MSSAVEMVWGFCEKAFDNLVDAFKAFIQSVLDDVLDPTLLLYGLQAFQVAAGLVLSRVDQLLARISSAIPKAALEQALEMMPTPKGLSSRSMSGERAYQLCATSIITGAVDFVSGTAPLAIRLIQWMKNKSSVWSFVLNPSFEKLLNILLRPFKVTLLRIVLTVWTILVAIVNFCFAVFGLLLFGHFIQRGEKDVLDSCYPQTARRKRRHLDNGELILRREPGGSKP